MFIYFIYSRDTRKVLAYFTSEEECISCFEEDYNSNTTSWVAINLENLMSIEDICLYDSFTLLLDSCFPSIVSDVPV